MSDTKVNYEKLPWGECKPYDGVSVFYRMDTIVVTSRGGDLLTRNKCDNSKTWVIGDSVASFSFDWLNLIKENVDAWIETELKELEEREREEAAKVAHPVPPDGYRLCSKEEAKNAPSCAKLYCKNQRWHELVDLQNIRCPLSEFYCTSAPRKFVRCTLGDVYKLFEIGAYVEWRRIASEGGWSIKAEAIPSLFYSADCIYRVDKYTIPEGFKLQPVMPTVRLPDGFGWVAIGSKIIAFEKDGLVMEVPSSKYHFDDFLRRQKLRQATLDAYNEIHDGET